MKHAQIVRNAIETVKAMPKKALIATVVIPGGFIVATIWISAKVLYKTLKDKK